MNDRAVAQAPLPRAYLSIVAQFAEAGGSGELNAHGYVLTGPTKNSQMPGDTITWLRLVTAGLVAGEGGRLLLTDAGRATAKAYRDGLVRNG